MLSESDRDRAERVIIRIGRDWTCLSELANAARVANCQMGRFLREHVPHENWLAREPVLERRIRQIRDIRRVQLSEYRRKVEVQVAEWFGGCEAFHAVDWSRSHNAADMRLLQSPTHIETTPHSV